MVFVWWMAILKFLGGAAKGMAGMGAKAGASGAAKAGNVMGQVLASSGGSRGGGAGAGGGGGAGIVPMLPSVQSDVTPGTQIGTGSPLGFADVGPVKGTYQPRLDLDEERRRRKGRSLFMGG